MGIIHVLDTEVSNKIAAGEVVERPVSIVKELVENSIDAGASVITVEIRGGGISYIRVTDNGSGMSAEDAKICFLRHATSKISTGADLNAIYTLGFRGEALSSIGAVSKVRLFTKRWTDSVGVCVTCEGGEILSSENAGAPNGTVMEVSDLFYNTPARRKFLKKPASEAGLITDMVGRYVFIHPEISFKLIRDGKEIIFSPGDNKLINSVYAVYGRDYARNMLEVDYEYNGIRVTGMIGKGNLTRANRGYENFYVNKRYIKNAIIIRALEEAYKNQIMISKFPVAILNLETDAALVDINVHPTKQECKFSQEQDIYQAVYHAVKSTLYAMPNVPEIERAEVKSETGQPGFAAERGEQRSIEDIFKEKVRRSVEQPVSEFKYKAEHRDTPVKLNPDREPQKPAPKRDVSTPTPAMPDEKFTDTDFGEFSRRIDRSKIAENIVSAPISPDENDSKAQAERAETFAMLDYAVKNALKRDRNLKVKDPTLPQAEEYGGLYLDNARRVEDDNIFNDGYFRVIGQLFETYILIEKDDRLLIIDQHAAHERLNYEALKSEMESTGVVSQMILEPVRVKLTGEERAVYCEHSKLFGELGFEVGTDGEDAVIISAVPGDVSWSDIEPLFLELLSLTGDMNPNMITAEKQRLLYTISCKTAIKANMKISEREMESLVKKVFALKNINTCPHGRPIVISMTKKEIEKNFKRIV